MSASGQGNGGVRIKTGGLSVKALRANLRGSSIEGT